MEQDFYMLDTCGLAGSYLALGKNEGIETTNSNRLECREQFAGTDP